KLQTQLYVNCRASDLFPAVLEALPSLRERQPTLKWVAPLQAADFHEPQDAEFLDLLGLTRYEEQLEAFWPVGGPVWDALAVCEFPDGSTGALLAEGKNYPQEMYSTGSQVGKSGSDRAVANKEKIERSISWTQQQLGVLADPGRWMLPLDPHQPSSSLYQTANRLSHLLWLRSLKVEAWFCHLLYLGDTLFGSSTREEWEQALSAAESRLGIEAADLPYAGHAYLPALDPNAVLAR